MDLLMNGSYTFSSLEKLYQKFSRPGAKIKVNGVNIIGVPGFKVTDITVSQSISVAGTATFNLVDCYDRVKCCFNPQISAVMLLGSKVEIALGYNSIYTDVFKGYIASMSWNFDNETGATCSITCMDARALMMEDFVYECYNGGNFKSIMESIVKPYKALCSSNIDSAITESVEGALRLTPECSVYNFIQKNLVEAGTIKKEFFILGENLYYRPARKQVLPIMTIGLGTGLLSFERSARYVNKAIEVIGQDVDNEKTVKFKTIVVSGEPQITVIQNRKTIIRAENIDMTDAAKMAVKETVVQVQKGVEGSGSCIGMPQIVPGRFIMITGLDSRVNGAHYITETTHSLSMSGYTTKITIGGQ